MHSLRICRLALSLSALLCTLVPAQNKPRFTSPNEKNPQKTAAARMSEGLDLSAPDRVDDQLYNRILWLMLKGDFPAPAARSHGALHALQSSE